MLLEKKNARPKTGCSSVLMFLLLLLLLVGGFLIVLSGPPTPPRPTRNNGGPCDPNTPVPPVPARNAGINSSTIAAQVAKIVEISRGRWPETAAHIAAAQAVGHPRYLTLDRPGADARRSQAVSICPSIPSWERDEYPPALFREGGLGASVRYVEPGDNGGVGAFIGNSLRRFPDGSIIEIKVVP